MKKNLLWLYTQFLAVGLLVSSGADAQDVVYFDDGSSVANTRLTNVVNDKVVLTVQRDGTTKLAVFSRPKILLSFTKAGNYLLVSELATDSIQARQQIQAFLSAPPRLDGNDYLIKAVPLTVIPARITYDNEEIVNYKTPGGNAASINKSELVAILYKDGRHALVAQASDAAPLLAEARPSLVRADKPVTPPAPRPEPVPPKVDVATVTPPDKPANMTNPQSVSTASSTRPMTDEEKGSYRQKSLLQVDKFLAYISVITDKDNSSSDKDLAIEEAMKLFVDPKNTTIEVTSTKRLGSRQVPLQQYLIRLKLLPYKYIKVEWVETNFVRDLTLESDGNYYGTIAGRQKFAAYGDKDQLDYSDETDKSVRVKLEPYKKIIDNTDNVKWRVLLGNIKVGSD